MPKREQHVSWTAPGMGAPEIDPVAEAQYPDGDLPIIGVGELEAALVDPKVVHFLIRAKRLFDGQQEQEG